MKTLLLFFGLFLIFQINPAQAATTAFNVSATIPDPTGVISITVFEVNSSNNQFTTEPSGFTSLSFDPLTFNTSTKTFLPDHYWAVDYAVTGGSGSPDVTFTYTEGANPNGSTNGLGYKITATFAKETTNGETLIGAQQRLIDLNGYHLPSTDFSGGGWCRSYIAAWTGNTNNPSNGQPFSDADAEGSYTGSLAVTTTVQ